MLYIYIFLPNVSEVKTKNKVSFALIDLVFQPLLNTPKYLLKINYQTVQIISFQVPSSCRTRIILPSRHHLFLALAAKRFKWVKLSLFTCKNEKK